MQTLQKYISSSFQKKKKKRKGERERENTNAENSTISSLSSIKRYVSGQLIIEYIMQKVAVVFCQLEIGNE